MEGSGKGSILKRWRRRGVSTLALGDNAPDFDLSDQYGQRHRLRDYRGRWLLLYFYPKDNTPGCTKEACRFRDDFAVFGQLNAVVLGASLDDAKSHRRFAEKHALSFPLLADADGNTAAAYGALWAFGPIKLARRHSFLIDPQGRIARIYRSVKPSRHSDEVAADLRSLMDSMRHSSPTS